MKKTHTLRAALTALVGGVLLAACNGGDGDGHDPGMPPPAAVIPDSALVSATAYTTYARTLTNSDTDMPVDIGKVNLPPTSETADPIAL